MTAWLDMSKPQLMTELAKLCRQLEKARTELRQARLKTELLNKVER